MKRIEFIKDYQGAETNQIQYLVGQVAMFPDSHADRLISDKVVKEYTEPKPEKADKKEKQEAQ
jgi:hypothetical protein